MFSWFGIFKWKQSLFKLLYTTNVRILCSAEFPFTHQIPSVGIFKQSERRGVWDEQVWSSFQRPQDQSGRWKCPCQTEDLERKCKHSEGAMLKCLQSKDNFTHFDVVMTVSARCLWGGSSWGNACLLFQVLFFCFSLWGFFFLNFLSSTASWSQMPQTVSSSLYVASDLTSNSPLINQ